MMKGCLFDGDFENICQRTLVLVGRKGNGKSATGNTIFGTNVFRSERSSSGVTTTFQNHSTKFEDGRMINVIDTPGIFGSCVDDIEFSVEDILSMAGDGIHAFLVVFSVGSRFSKEEEAVISLLRLLFGSKIYDYMILVFTGGDQLHKDNQTLKDYLQDSSQNLKEILCLSQKRFVLFDNKTEDETKRTEQVEKLFSIVNMVSKKNGEKLYNNEMFVEWKKEAKEQAQHIQTKPEILLTVSTHEGHVKRIFEMIEPKMKMTVMSLERQLAEEQAARLKAEQDVEAIKKKSDQEIGYLVEQIEMTKRPMQKQVAFRKDVPKFFTNRLCLIL